jgi:pyruvate formate lyase activating enzyme
MKGLIFSVRRYSVHDGPGIRVAFFMKGCPLKCIWCHNPEGISSLPGSVVQVNKVGDKEFSNHEEVGKYYTVNDILDLLEKDKIFINQSKGGITFTGGEPMLQSEFLLKALKACKANGYHTAVDTSGYSSNDSFKSIIPFTDLFLFDIKHMYDPAHLQLTGVSNEGIISNLRYLLLNAVEIWVRIPVVPGLNDDLDNMERIKHFIITTGSNSLTKINLLPFHKIGSSKYKKFNIPYRLGNVEAPSKERMKELQDFLSDTGVSVRVGG